MVEVKSIASGKTKVEAPSATSGVAKAKVKSTASGKGKAKVARTVPGAPVVEAPSATSGVAKAKVKSTASGKGKATVTSTAVGKGKAKATGATSGEAQVKSPASGLAKAVVKSTAPSEAKAKSTALGKAKAEETNATSGAALVEAKRATSATDRAGDVGRASCAARSARGLAAPASWPVRLLLDTGAAVFLANGEQGKLFEVSDSRRVSAKDAQRHLFDATGCGSLWVMVPTTNDPRLKLLTDQLFHSNSLEGGLGGHASIRRLGWRLQDRATGAFLVAPDGDEVELEVDKEGLLWLNFDVVPPSVALGRLHAQMSRIPISGAPIRLGGARAPVHWPSRLTEEDTEDLPEPSRRDAQPKPKAPPRPAGRGPARAAAAERTAQAQGAPQQAGFGAL